MSRSVICINLSAASALVSLAIFSSFSCCLPRMSRISFLSCSISSSLLRRFSLRLSSSSSLRSKFSSRVTSRPSRSFSSLRRDCSSRRVSSISLRESSLAWSISFAASFLAFWSSFSAFSSAELRLCLVITVLAPKPTASPTIEARKNR